MLLIINAFQRKKYFTVCLDNKPGKIGIFTVTYLANHPSLSDYFWWITKDSKNLKGVQRELVRRIQRVIDPQ